MLKGSELAPKCFWALGDVFRQAGLPAGCLNVIYHQSSDAAAITNALIAHPAVRKVNFTGSTMVGSIIASTAGKYIKPVLLELGGKASAIVLDDADLDKAAMNCAVGAFLHVSIEYPCCFLSFWCVGLERSLTSHPVWANLHVHRTHCGPAWYCGGI